MAAGKQRRRARAGGRVRRRASPGGKLLRSRLGGVLRWLLPRVVVFVSYVLFRSCRIRFVDKRHEDRFLEAGQPIIFAGWHEGMMMLPYHFRDRRGGLVMVSPSRDGDIIADTIARFGLRPVRGSSGRDGRAALDAMVAAVRAERQSAGIIVDGPKGPPLVAKTGAVALARATGLPIVPGTWWARPAIRFGSWDHTIVPLPFARVAFAFEEPIFVAPDADEATMEAHRATLTERLGRARARARAAVDGAAAASPADAALGIADSASQG
jgi:lysophospholipid acyltransferase (LPLAT)-like uncharacterized protein